MEISIITKLIFAIAIIIINISASASYNFNQYFSHIDNQKISKLNDQSLKLKYSNNDNADSKDNSDITNEETTPKSAKAQLANLNDINYGIKLGLGSPIQIFNCIITTKSKDFWINGKKCSNCNKQTNIFDESNSKTFVKSDVTGYYNYTHKGVEGFIASDQLLLPEIYTSEINDFMYVTKQWRLDNIFFDGVFSISFPGEYFVQLKKKGLIEKAQCGLLLRPVNENSYLTIGEYDKSIVADNTLIFWEDVDIKDDDDDKIEEKSKIIDESSPNVNIRLLIDSQLNGKEMPEINNDNENESKHLFNFTSFDHLVEEYENNININIKNLNNTNISTNSNIKDNIESSKSSNKQLAFSFSTNSEKVYTSKGSKPKWTITATDFKLNDNSIFKDNNNKDNGNDNKIKLIVDSMTYGFNIPKKHFFDFKDHLFPAESNCQISRNNYFNCNCNENLISKYPNITFSLNNGNKLVFTPDEYIILNINQIDYSDTCKVLISINYDDDLWSLGTTALNKYYTLFDYENKKVGFYNVKQSSENPGNKIIMMSIIIIASSCVFFILIYILYRKFYNYNESNNNNNNNNDNAGNVGNEHNVDNDALINERNRINSNSNNSNNSNNNS